MIDIEQEFIKMYATLEKSPVRVSYPAGQPKSYIDASFEYRWRNDFKTIYKFGPYRIEHTKPAMEFSHLTGELVDFCNEKSGYEITFFVRHENEELSERNKKFWRLYQDVKTKSDLGSFINPIEKEICDNIYKLELYARNAMTPQQAEKIMAKLDKIKLTLLKTQNIKR